MRDTVAGTDDRQRFPIDNPDEETPMATFDCPWCEEAALLPFPLPEEMDAQFSCSTCGITIDWAEEPAELDLAA